MTAAISYIALTGSLGCGFQEASLDRGVERGPAFIGSDSGSTDGGGGGDLAVTGYLQLVDRIARSEGWKLQVACVYTEPERGLLQAKYSAEQIQRALDTGADVVLVGRCADAAVYAAIPLAQGFDPAAVWNAAKIMECGAAAAENRSGQDSLLCTMDDDGFVLEPLDPAVRCTPGSVAAHTLYEVSDPYRLVMPSGVLDARAATYTAVDERRWRTGCALGSRRWRRARSRCSCAPTAATAPSGAATWCPTRRCCARRGG